MKRVIALSILGFFLSVFSVSCNKCYNCSYSNDNGEDWSAQKCGDESAKSAMEDSCITKAANTSTIGGYCSCTDE